MPRTNQITTRNRNILLIGDAGTHKTWFLGGCPEPFIFDFDQGLSILRHKSIEYQFFRDLQRGLTPTKKESEVGLYPFGSGWPAFVKRLKELGAELDKGARYETIGLDSITHLSFLAINKICLDTGSFWKESPDLPQPHQGIYGAQQEYLKYVLGQVTAWPIRLVATVHIQRDKNDITGRIEKLPLVTGKLAGFISSYFGEVWFCEYDDKVKKFVVRTAKTPELTQCKSHANIPDGTELDYGILSKWLDAETPPEATPRPSILAKKPLAVVGK